MITIQITYIEPLFRYLSSRPRRLHNPPLRASHAAERWAAVHLVVWYCEPPTVSFSSPISNILGFHLPFGSHYEPPNVSLLQRLHLQLQRMYACLPSREIKLTEWYYGCLVRRHVLSSAFSCTSRVPASAATYHWAPRTAFCGDSGVFSSWFSGFHWLFGTYLCRSC